ncbi:MAG: hypothetical protein NWE89_02590 [Candidatus Bathyarchaeota archaeon]|nr:hypothetical protein [Candidatus Bathyarchaeota archaeon]
MDSLKDIIEETVKQLKEKEQAKDNIMARARKARTLSKQAIMHQHNGEMQKSTKNLMEATKLLKEIKESGSLSPELMFYESVQAARQEYAEASILQSLLAEGRYPSPRDLNIAETNYVLGLADVPGELRRESLDRLREGDLATAEKHLETMEEIYLHLIRAEEASLFLKGLRRKLDITRSVNERTRAEITAEAGRRRLAEKLEKFKE